MRKPAAVLISDIHYNISTLALADAAMRMAIAEANDLEVPLIVCGDLHDTKANLRGECVNAMIETFKLCSQPPYILRGNHDAINEKSAEHSLNFLGAAQVEDSDSGNWDHLPTTQGPIIVDSPQFTNEISVDMMSVHLIPYHHDSDELRAYLRTVDKVSTLIMHQGLTSSNSGEYIQDKSAINPQDVAGLRVISGHYHTRQTITLPDGGTWDYIGNPYTLNYAEANDPPKGFQVLMDDGSLEFVPTNLRKHAVIELQVTEDTFSISSDRIPVEPLGSEDLVWIKIYGAKEDLMFWSKDKVGRMFDLKSFRLDLIPTDTKTSVDARLNLSQGLLFDSLIDSLTHTSDEKKTHLKQIWKDFL